jgi:hypothetical protein
VIPVAVFAAAFLVVGVCIARRPARPRWQDPRVRQFP